MGRLGMIEMDIGAQHRRYNRQDKERNEGENFTSLRRRDCGPNKEQPDQEDT